MFDVVSEGFVGATDVCQHRLSARTVVRANDLHRPFSARLSTQRDKGRPTPPSSN